MTCNETYKLFESIMDCEASEEEQKRFFKHLDKCGDCFDHYELDELFKKFIKKHESKTCCPPEFIENIKRQIKDLPA